MAEETVQEPQKDRLSEIEERLGSVEDLLLINKFDIMKMEEEIKKGVTIAPATPSAPATEGAPAAIPSADIAKMQQKINEIEAAVQAVTNTAATDMERAKELASRMTGKIDVSVLKNLEEKIDELSKKVEDVEKRPAVVAAPAALDTEFVRKAVGSDLDTVRRTFLEDIGRKSEAINARLKDLEKSTQSVPEELKKINEKVAVLGKAPAKPKLEIDEKKIMENVKKELQDELKIFALNSEVEKLWKLYEEQKNYVDEKTKMFDVLQDQIKVWEKRAEELQMTKKSLDDMLKAFPEMNFLQSKLTTIERKLLDLQKHVVVAKMSQPIVLE